MARRFITGLGKGLAWSAAAATIALSLVTGALRLAVGPVGLVSIADDTSVRFVYGTAEVRHLYDHRFAPAVPKAQWHAHAVARGWTDPPRPVRSTPTDFHLSSGHVMGIGGSTDGQPMISPARYWLLRVPLWLAILPGPLAASLLVARWHAGRHCRRRGFPVGAPAQRA